jgi:uncharacterized membrane protein (UPF0127 family)
MKPRKIAAVALVLLLAGCGGEEQGDSQNSPQSNPQACGKSTSSGDMNTSELSTVTIYASSGEKVRVRVEIADNDLSRGLGLMGRESLPENRGMLFVYSEEDLPSYTMANTPLPLSIAFIDSERRIIDIQDMKPFDDEPPGYAPPEPVQYALEVNKGFYDERGVEVGDCLTLPE